VNPVNVEENLLDESDYGEERSTVWREAVFHPIPLVERHRHYMKGGKRI